MSSNIKDPIRYNGKWMDFFFLEPNFAITHSIQSLQWGACVGKEGSIEAAAGEEAAVAHYGVPLRVHLAELPVVARRHWQIKRKDLQDLPRSKRVPDMCYCHITPEPSFTAIALYKDSQKNGTAFLMIFRMTDLRGFFFSSLHRKRVHTETTTEVVCPQKRPTRWHSTKAPVCHRHFYWRFVFQENNLTGRWVRRPQRCATARWRVIESLGNNMQYSAYWTWGQTNFALYGTSVVVYRAESDVTAPSLCWRVCVRDHVDACQSPLPSCLRKLSPPPASDTVSIHNK